jgi:hypothetical protein
MITAGPGMNIWLRRSALLAPVALLGFQTRSQREVEAPDIRLPSGKSQREELLKYEHKQNLKDLDRIIAMAQDLKQEFEKNEHHVLSLGAIKKTEEMEKLIRRIRSRMQRH